MAGIFLLHLVDGPLKHGQLLRIFFIVDRSFASKHFLEIRDSLGKLANLIEEVIFLPEPLYRGFSVCCIFAFLQTRLRIDFTLAKMFM